MNRTDKIKMVTMIGGIIGVIAIKSGVKPLITPGLMLASFALGLTIYDIIDFYRDSE